MKAAQFEYIRPPDLGKALQLLSERREEAKVLAGGQSLGPMLNLRLARPQMLIDIARLEALRRIEDLGAQWRIGAAVTHSRLEDAALPGAEMLTHVACGIAPFATGARSAAVSPTRTRLRTGPLRSRPSALPRTFTVPGGYALFL